MNINVKSKDKQGTGTYTKNPLIPQANKITYQKGLYYIKVYNNLSRNIKEIQYT